MYHYLFIVCVILCGISHSAAEQCTSSVFPPDSQSGCCGISNGSSLRKNTTIAEIDEYPWMALIEYKEQNNITVFRCSAILISGRYALSGAVCFSGRHIENGNSIPINVRLGDYDTSNEGKDCVEVNPGQEKCNDAAISVPIEKVTSHPNFERVTLRNDIAVIRLAQQIEYTDFIRPICLPSLDISFRPPKHFYLTVAGWGRDKLEGELSKVLRRVLVPFVDMQICKSKYRELWKFNLTNDQLCAGGQHRDACHGDAGGPLMYFYRNKTELAGIVSFGPHICGGGSPGVYTKVFAYKDWIQSVIEEDSKITSTTSTTTDSGVIYFID